MLSKSSSRTGNKKFTMCEEAESYTSLHIQSRATELL